MPILVYFTLRPEGRRIAFWGALAFIFSGIPYYFSWGLMSDHLHAFLLVCSLVAFAQLMQSRSDRWALFFAFMISLTWYTRPISMLIPGLFILILMIYRGSFRKDFRLNVRHSAIIAIFTICFFLLGSAFHSARVHRFFHLGVTQNYAANQMLVTYYYVVPAYIAMKNHEPMKPVIVPANGPATKKLFDMVHKSILEPANGWKTTPEAKRFNGDPEAYMNDIIQHPHKMYFYIILWRLDAMYNTQQIDDVMSGVIKEALLTRPEVLHYAIWNFF